jgi:2-polyprenyl-3-methyl-5-hydroxy-6-metoxy-1,4-benzoquinol methylase
MLSKIKYVYPDSNHQISALLHLQYLPKVYYRLCLLLTKFIKKNNFYEFLFNLFKKKNADDLDVFAKILPFMKRAPAGESSDAAYYEYAAQKLISHVGELPIIKNYLDFGCGRCDMTAHVGREVGLGPSNIYATDVKDEFEVKWADVRAQNSAIQFAYADEDRPVPFDVKFDLVTCAMVLHHVPPKRLPVVLRALSDSMRSGAVLILKEHDCTSVEDRIFADLVHSLFLIQQSGTVPKERIFAQKIWYKSAEEWTADLSKVGLEPVHPYAYADDNLTKNYTMVYKKT